MKSFKKPAAWMWAHYLNLSVSSSLSLSCSILLNQRVRLISLKLLQTLNVHIYIYIKQCNIWHLHCVQCHIFILLQLFINFQKYLDALKMTLSDKIGKNNGWDKKSPWLQMKTLGYVPQPYHWLVATNFQSINRKKYGRFTWLKIFVESYSAHGTEL